MNYELKVTETGRKAAKYKYQVIDEAGNVITERNSNREYVACSIDGQFFFGRLDLIGKGYHGNYAKNRPRATAEELQKVNTIAYRK